MTPFSIGIIGCGHISDAYLRGAARSSLVRVAAVADLNADAAQNKAAAYDVEAVSVEQLLARDDIEAIVNLTVPLAHAAVSRQSLEAGKHVYSEKPLATDFQDALALIRLAQERSLRIGSAPDTFMGGAHQAARRLIDEGRVGRILGGAACVASRGMEMWHPNPAFFFKEGGGPVLDMGPYYITQLVNLLGPVRRVTGLATTGLPQRTITSQPLHGQVIDVDIPTFVNAALAFQSGANIAFTASWETWKSHRRPLELYGEAGTLLVPDPNFFGGDVEWSEGWGDWQSADHSNRPFRKPNLNQHEGDVRADYRMIGLIDMACAIRQNRAHRASGALALHVLEVMMALTAASTAEQHLDMTTTCARPDPVPEGDGEEVFLA